MCFFVLFGASRRPAFLRFRTNDVLLGTLGAGVRICGVSNSPVYYYYFWLYRLLEPICLIILDVPFTIPIASVTASERSRVRNSILTLILLFTPERALFCSNASYVFELVSSRLALGRCSFFVTGPWDMRPEPE